MPCRLASDGPERPGRCRDAPGGAGSDHPLHKRRVRSVTVGGQPLDPEKTYTLSSYTYTILDQGDGYTMFDGAKVLQTGEKYNFEVIYRYLTETLGGRVGAGYENPYGDGRIVFVSPES